MRRATKFVVLGAVLVVLAVAVLIWGLRRECQRGNCESGAPEPEPTAGGAEPSHDFEHPFVSDPSLSRPSQHRIVGVLLDAAGNPDGERVPYVVVFADGRWASGFTTKGGATHPIFSARPVPFRVYCCDEAYQYADAHRKPGSGGTKHDGGDTKPLNCKPVDAGVDIPTGHFVVQCLEW